MRDSNEDSVAIPSVNQDLACLSSCSVVNNMKLNFFVVSSIKGLFEIDIRSGSCFLIDLMEQSIKSL